MTERRGPLPVTRHPLGDPVVAEAWRQLQDLGATTPFETWPWLEGLAEQPGTPLALIAWSRNRPVGALAVELTDGPRGLRRLVLAGSTWLAPDHCEVVAAPDRREWAAQSILRSIATMPGWDLLDFSGLPADGTLATELRRLDGVRFRHLAVEEVRCPYVALDGRDGTAASFSRNLRSQVGRGLRAVERTGGGLEVVEDVAAIGPALDRLMDLHNARFAERSAVFATEDRRRYHRRTATRLAEQGRARIYRLTDGSTDLAMLYALRFGNRLSYYSMGLGDGPGSPGLTVLGQAILSAAGEGAVEFDLLRGEHEFKLRFATGTRIDERHRVLRLGAGAVTRAGLGTLRRWNPVSREEA